MAAPNSYFYALEQADIYDDVVRLTDQAYDMVHDVTALVLSNWLAQNAKRRDARSAGVVLDIGCGTGEQTRRLLRMHERCRVVCLDSSPAMLARLAANMELDFASPTAHQRVVTVEADVTTGDWLGRALESATRSFGVHRFDAVLSVYCLHHFTAVQKARIYSTIGDHLERGAPFVNTDLFSFATPWLARLAQQREEACIEERFHAHSVPLEVGNWAAVKAAWLEHVRLDNVPLPIHMDGLDDPIPHGAGCEASILRQAGFSSVEVLARHFQSAVLSATK